MQSPVLIGPEAVRESRDGAGRSGGRSKDAEQYPSGGPTLPAQEPKWENVATGGPRSAGTARRARRSGGPRRSIDRATVSEGSAPSGCGVDGRSAGWNTGAAAWSPAEGRAASAARTVITQLHPLAHPAAPAAASRELPLSQFGSRDPSGATQQQAHGDVPHVRPSHCHDANACGAAQEPSSVRTVSSQIVRKPRTRSLSAKSGRDSIPTFRTEPTNRQDAKSAKRTEGGKGRLHSTNADCGRWQPAHLADLPQPVSFVSSWRFLASWRFKSPEVARDG